MTQRILFVCLGNICRSPAAEGVFRQMAREAGLDAVADSAGTGNWHVGDPPYGPMQDAARARGYDLSDLRARQVTPADFERFDLVLAMDDRNLSDLMRLRRGGAVPRLFTDYSDGPEDHVPDPYYTRDFDGALALIERCSEGLIQALRRLDGRHVPL